MRKTFAKIDLGAFKENYLTIRRATARKVMAVVKADAYGHGMLQCVKALKTLGDASPEYFAVAMLDEALEFKRQYPNDRLLVFAPLEKDEIAEYAGKDIIATVYEPSHIEMLRNSGVKNIKVHVKIDTGMGRIGVDYSNAFKFIKQLSELKNVTIDGIYTHFATSDEKNKDFANLQLSRLKAVIKELSGAKIEYGLAHAANSGAILDMPDAFLDMVRPGIILYGYYPSLETTESLKFKPVMSIVSEVTTVKKINRGTSVSYGRRFISNDDTTIVSVSMGYADGYLRALTNKGSAIINGKFYSQVGQVCMDRIMFEVPDADVAAGDKVILLGEENGISIDAWDWAKILGTIPYEITCGISKRVPRRYTGY